MKSKVFMTGGPLIIILSVLLIGSCTSVRQSFFHIQGSEIKIEFDESMYSRILSKTDDDYMPMGDFTASEFITVSGYDIQDFKMSEDRMEEITDDIGKGRRYILIGENDDFRKEIEATLYDAFPAMVFYQVKYTNIGNNEKMIQGWTNNSYEIQSKDSKMEDPPFWSYQSGSYEERPDWVLPLEAGFNQENYMGMNATDYGGGTPVSDIWCRDYGLAVGHVEMVPKLVSLPVSMSDSKTAQLGVHYKVNETLSPGMSLITFRTFVSVHQGDYFRTLSNYSRFMQAKGMTFDKWPDTVYEPIWCAWGFQRDFTMDQIYGALPKAKELGFEWAVLDDGWQTAEGDWYLTRDKFPGGDRDMKKLVHEIQKRGLKAKLWWAPLAVDPGTDLMKNHPEYLLLNEDGSKQDISWWNAYYLCPAYDEVLEFTRKQVITMMKTWGFEGLKIDGQHLNGAPPCYNSAHHHVRPEESVEGIPGFFKMIYETALSINPDAVVEICPCGTAYNFHTMPFMNQSVASDPESSWQIRLKGKTFKALMGPQAAYYGDHVELSDNRDDFASTVGIGGVIGTKFTWPVGAKEGSKIDLILEKETQWKKWVDIYKDKMLPMGEYLGDLYDLGFDRPEAHAIKKGDRMYYAFYEDEFKGDIKLKGLDRTSYRITDYVHNQDLGTVVGPEAKLEVAFEKSLLIEAVPE